MLCVVIVGTSDFAVAGNINPNASTTRRKLTQAPARDWRLRYEMATLTSREALGQVVFLNGHRVTGKTQGLLESGVLK